MAVPLWTADTTIEGFRTRQLSTSKLSPTQIHFKKANTTENMQDPNSMFYSGETAIKFHTIGAGFCGTVWAASETGSAYKREDGGPFRCLENDYNMHRRAIQSIRIFNGLNRSSNAITPQISNSRLRTLHHSHGLGLVGFESTSFSTGIHSMQYPTISTNSILSSTDKKTAYRKVLSASDG